MEHLNREAKNGLTGLGSNITEAAVSRVGKCIGQLSEILKNFDEVNNIKKPSDRHSKKSLEKDMAVLLDQLVNAKVTLKNFKANPTKSLSIPFLDAMSLIHN